MDKLLIKLLIKYKEMFGEGFPLMMVSQDEEIWSEMVRNAISTKTQYVPVYDDVEKLY